MTDRAEEIGAAKALRGMASVLRKSLAGVERAVPGNMNPEWLSRRSQLLRDAELMESVAASFDGGMKMADFVACNSEWHPEANKSSAAH